MRVIFLGSRGTWKDVKNAARTTVSKEHAEGEPSSMWKRRMLLAEHSPIRLIHIKWKWVDLRRWVSDHLVRHWLGIVHFVSTQRDDRNNYAYNRDELLQGSLVSHEAEATAQAIINISRKRLCLKASPETLHAWKEALEEIKEEQPEVYSVAVPDCIYRGYCYEMESCGYFRSEAYQEALRKYREGINVQN